METLPERVEQIKVWLKKGDSSLCPFNSLAHNFGNKADGEFCKSLFPDIAEIYFSGPPKDTCCYTCPCSIYRRSVVVKRAREFVDSSE